MAERSEAGSATFAISSESPTFAALRASEAGGNLENQPELETWTSWSGGRLDEPNLVFSSSHSLNEARAPSPQTGLSDSRPYDVANLTEFGFELEVGVVCPGYLAPQLDTFLEQIDTPTNLENVGTKEYPGFRRTSKQEIQLPSYGDDSWADLDDHASPDTRTSKLARRLSDATKTVGEYTDTDVVVVCIPEGWSSYETDATFDPQLDLRRLFKAATLKHNVAMQLIREPTLSRTNDSDTLWNFALGLYTKALNTPWTIEAIGNDTVFAGLGFALRPSKKSETDIAIGCSHLFDRRGMGIDYLVTELDQPTFDGRNNPHLSFDDAQRFGERVLHTYFHAYRTPPRRVVIHKNTNYLGEEVAGLLRGLQRVDEVELLQIYEAGSIRGLASRIENGTLRGPDDWPVRRGSYVVLSDDRFLVWLHGTSPDSSGTSYPYRGQRIPKPLMVRRYHGSASAETLAWELLGLSKMNWNTTVPYAKEPVTIEAAREIARIGGLLNSPLPTGFDYRLFI